MIMTSPLSKSHGFYLAKHIAEGSSFLYLPFYTHIQMKMEKGIVFPVFHHMQSIHFQAPL